MVRQALDDLDLLEIGGGTQMALGMRSAIDEVKRNLASNRLNRVLVLTDGQTYEETACIDLANQYRDYMSFSTMGVGAEFNEKLLQRIAQDSHGKYHFIGDPAEIPGIFDDELQGLRGVSIRNGRIEVTLAQGVQVREAFAPARKSMPSARRWSAATARIDYELGDLEAGVAGSVLLTLVLPPRRPGPVRIGQAALRFEVPGHGEQVVNTYVTAEYSLDRTLTSRERPGHESGRSGVDRQAAIEGGRRVESGQCRSGDAPAQQRDPRHPAARQRQGDAGLGLADGSGQENPDAPDQGGQDHPAASAGSGAQDADA